MTTATTRKITYTSANADMEGFHKEFDTALENLKSQFGREHSLFIDGKNVASSNPPLEDRMPADQDVLLGKFASASPQDVADAIKAAKIASKAWGATPWSSRGPAWTPFPG